MWCCDGDEICSSTKPNQCDKCAANADNTSRLSTTSATTGTLLVTQLVDGKVPSEEVPSGLSRRLSVAAPTAAAAEAAEAAAAAAAAPAAAGSNTPALRSPTWPFGQLGSALGDPIGCKSDCAHPPVILDLEHPTVYRCTVAPLSQVSQGCRFQISSHWCVCVCVCVCVRVRACVCVAHLDPCIANRS